eukprot:scaffold2983_cov53-Attheya_sp.AAC.2
MAQNANSYVPPPDISMAESDVSETQSLNTSSCVAVTGISAILEQEPGEAEDISQTEEPFKEEMQMPECAPEKTTRSPGKWKKRMCILIPLVLVIAAATGAAVYFTSGGDGDSGGSSQATGLGVDNGGTVVVDTTPSPTTATPTISPVAAITDSPTIAVTTLAPSITIDKNGTVYQLALNISGPAILEQTDSAAFAAFDWLNKDIITSGDSVAYDELVLKERYSLAVTYFSLLGSTVAPNRRSLRRVSPKRSTNEEERDLVQVNQEGMTVYNPLEASFMPPALDDSTSLWLTPGLHHCEWDGIVCDDTSKCVTKIGLPRMGLEGTLPQELNQFTKIETLDLVENTLTGPLPMGIYDLASLKFLYLNDNKISGSISSFIGRLDMLHSLEMSNNQLTGSLPLMTRMNKITYISFLKNRLTGPIPGFPGKVRFFDIGSNQMTGTLPETISSHGHIRFLYLDNNKFTGTIPSDYPSMGSTGNGASRVQEVWVNNNELVGDLPTTWNKLIIVTIRAEGNKDLSVPKEACTASVMRGNDAGEMRSLFLTNFSGKVVDGGGQSV